MTTAADPRRGRPALLDEQRVIDAAFALLDTEGLPAVSFRRIGTELGVSHMTIYSCFASKDALLEALAAKTIDVPSIHPGAEVPWDTALVAAIHDIHGALTGRPAVAELLVTLPLSGAWIERVREPLLDILRGAGFDDRKARDGISVLFNYLLGAVQIDTRRARGGSPSAFDLGLGYLVDGLRADAPAQATNRRAARRRP